MIFSYLLKYLNNIITKGNLIIYYKNQKVSINSKDQSIVADITILNNKFFTNIFSKSDIGLGESYIKQHFTTSNLLSLLTLIALNFNINTRIEKISFINKFAYKIINWIRKNSIKQSAKNISYHYDLGNDFYKIWLDESMSYSSAMFINKDDTLFNAQQNKYNSILDTLEIKMGKNLNILEIGCGFGGFAELALLRGHNVTAITISKEQYLYAQNRLKPYIENKQCNLLLQDYRTMKGTFDAVVSIEMFEAVGKEYWNIYFKTIYKNLKHQGIAIIQTIYIQQQFYKMYKNSSDFIRHYIFPGGYLPTEKLFISKCKFNKLQYVNKKDFGISYSKTLQIWLNTFNNNLKDIKEMNYNNEFIRMWQFYLAICSAAFEANRISVAQYELLKI